jgi:hypothetical protein
LPLRDAVLVRLPGARIITPAYATEEAHRNLSIVGHRRELEELLDYIEVVSAVASADHLLFLAIGLSDKTAPYWSQRSS